jgi:hypothetical protein
MLDSDPAAVQQIVNDLHDVDPRSTDARYADGETATGLVESLAKVPDGFNPEHFAAVLTKVSDLFDGIRDRRTVEVSRTFGGASTARWCSKGSDYPINPENGVEILGDPVFTSAGFGGLLH